MELKQFRKCIEKTRTQLEENHQGVCILLKNNFRGKRIGIISDKFYELIGPDLSYWDEKVSAYWLGKNFTKKDYERRKTALDLFEVLMIDRKLYKNL